MMKQVLHNREKWGIKRINLKYFWQKWEVKSNIYGFRWGTHTGYMWWGGGTNKL